MGLRQLSELLAQRKQQIRERGEGENGFRFLPARPEDPQARPLGRHFGDVGQQRRLADPGLAHDEGGRAAAFHRLNQPLEKTPLPHPAHQPLGRTEFRAYPCDHRAHALPLPDGILWGSTPQVLKVLSHRPGTKIEAPPSRPTTRRFPTPPQRLGHRDGPSLAQARPEL